jgi:NAD-dependent deacetylase
VASSPVEIPKGLVRSIHNAEKIAVLTGSGISAESGVPTFREAQTGLWSRFDPMELATPQAFQRDPRLVWEWYAWRRGLISKAEPNPAHLALAEIEKRLARFTLITQNVDGLHQKAGSRGVIELHGNIWRTKCSLEGTIVEKWDEDGDPPPRCPSCAGFLRPDVVWFGENLPLENLSAAIQAAQNCDVFLSVGTSSLVQPAASLPLLAKEAGAVVVEVNPDPTPLAEAAGYVLRGPAGKVLPELIRAVWGRSSGEEAGEKSPS